jgi:polyisoprenoid-binding protein YceI
MTRFQPSTRFAAFGFCLAGLLGNALALEYQIDGAHSDVLFRVKHMGISTVTGRFDQVSGSFDVDPKNIAATKGSAVIQVATINTNNGKRDGHLKGEDFFNVAKFPEIKFVSKSVRNVNMADSTCDLVGDITIRDVTKEIILKVKGTGLIKDDWGNDRAAFHASGKINRTDFGLKWNKLVEAAGTLSVGEMVDLDLSFEGTHPIAAPAAEPVKPAAKAPKSGK